MTKLIIISAPSGGGKTTLCQKLLQDFPELVLSVSSTTRPPRGNEKNGREYHFISKQEFESRIRAGRFAEWAEVHSNYYGTSLDVIEQVKREEKSLLLDIDVQGAESLATAYPAISRRIFIAPPSLKELEARLRARRTDSEEAIQQRLLNAKQEMSRLGDFDYVVINDSLEHAYRELQTILTSILRPPPPGEKPSG